MGLLRAFVISAGRPMNVPKMVAFGVPLVWIVPRAEAGEYVTCGAERVLPSEGLVDARNLALDFAQAQGDWCVQLSDDLKRVRLVEDGNITDPPLAEVIDLMIAAADIAGAKLAGVGPTDNGYFVRRPVTLNGFCVGDMIAVHPECPLRFDPDLFLKEDYDYTLQHLDKYGVVARCDKVLASFAHRTNRGGAVTYRTPELEDKMIGRLKAKWGDRIKDNPRRPHEVLLNWKA